MITDYMGVEGGGREVWQKTRLFTSFFCIQYPPLINTSGPFKAVRDYHNFLKCNFRGVSQNDYKLYGGGLPRPPKVMT